jgi:hypothetical protein
MLDVSFILFENQMIRGRRHQNDGDCALVLRPERKFSFLMLHYPSF